MLISWDKSSRCYWGETWLWNAAGGWKLTLLFSGSPVRSSGGRGSLALLWEGRGWLLLLCSNLGSKKANRPQLSKEEAFGEDEMVWRTSRTCLPLLSGGSGGGEKENGKLFKKCACGESSETVRLSLVLLDSGKFVFSLFSVFSKFSNM